MNDPVRKTMLPYGKQYIDDDDIAAVVGVLRSDWLTTGPNVGEFEEKFAAYCGAAHAVAVSNGTAALHAATHALGIGAGDEVIVTPLTFAASANCVLYVGGTPVFADVTDDALLIDPDEIRSKVTSRTKAIVSVDYAGHPCEYDEIQKIADEHGLAIIADACHALGGTYKGRRVGTLANANVFSLHPVKHVTTGEGGVITTDDEQLARKMRVFRSHGITSDHRQREHTGSWFYEMVDLGYNYRITDFQCALGSSQLNKADRWLTRRRQIADTYRSRIAEIHGIEALGVAPDVEHAYHLFVIRVDEKMDRAKVYSALRAEGIGVNVHYVPVHLHPFYRQHLKTAPGMLPRAEQAYERIISLPMFPMMTDSDVEDVMRALQKVVVSY